MFYALMAVRFWHRGSALVWRVMATLMVILSLSTFKDICFIFAGTYNLDWQWDVMSAFDMIAEPFYAFVAIELCRPGTVMPRMIALHEAPFVIAPVIMVCTHNVLWFRIELIWGILYGLYYLRWTVREVPRYHKRLQERFSYFDNINLSWMRFILVCFLVILLIWVADNSVPGVRFEIPMLPVTLATWMIICHFLLRHELVIKELREYTPEEAERTEEEQESSAIGCQIEKLFIVDRIYLNPRLKLSDVAAMIGSNRTYVSNYFNREKESTFYDYVNRMRVDHACNLLASTDDTTEEVAEKSGFNSQSTFYRVFTRMCGCTPLDYRCCHAPYRREEGKGTETEDPPNSP